NYQKFRQMCGTGIITEMDGGAKFDFTLIFNFNSVTEKDGAVKIAGINTFADALKLIQNRGQISPGTKIDFSLNIIATQQGGTPESLAALFGKYATTSKTTDSSGFLMSTLKNSSGVLNQDGNTFSLNCNMGAGQSNPCINLINDLTVYATKLESQVTTNNLYYSNPIEKRYSWEIEGLKYTKNPNVNQDEQDKLWKQYSHDEQVYRYINRYLNYLQNIESQDIIEKNDKRISNERSVFKSGLSDLIIKLQEIKLEYTNVMTLYNQADIKRLIKDCYTDITKSCKKSSEEVFKQRRAKFKNENITDKLINYLMNSEYVGDFYTKATATKASMMRCTLMPISTFEQAMYLADCQQVGNEKPRFLLELIHNKGKLYLRYMIYDIGENKFIYYNYNDINEKTDGKYPDTYREDDIQSAYIFLPAVKDGIVHAYKGTMQVAIISKAERVDKTVNIDLYRIVE
ncbi:MAG: hypothetical protein K0R49_693, partial [Burkholderiales bacterium]|nr:hypothetical protein [Burkholderiales bacterium]